jgi:DNA-binding PadR family transcriptional regulator
MLLDEFILGSKERIVKAFLDVVMLSLLSKHAMSGYEIDKELVKKFGLMIGPSTIYSKLSTLEKQGFISCATKSVG